MVKTSAQQIRSAVHGAARAVGAGSCRAMLGAPACLLLLIAALCLCGCAPEPPAIDPADRVTIDLTSSSFTAKVRKNEGVALVDFWATWCGPCRQVAPTVEAVAAKYEGRVVVGKVDVDKEPALAKEFGVRGILVLKVFKNGEVVGELAGVNSQRRIEAMLDKHLAE